MIIVNKPEKTENVQCYKCGAVFHVHLMQNMNGPFVTDCNLHKIKCHHEAKKHIFCLNTLKNKCVHCGEFYE